MSLRDKIEANQSVLIAYSALMTALVFISTVVISISIPATKGFFNIGEFGVYIASLTGGPIVGLIAGGLGSALADVFLGYEYYAPITFIVKGLEGLIVGYLAYALRKIKFAKWIAVSASIFTVILAISIGSSFVVGDVVVSIFSTEYTVSISTLLWGAVGVIMLVIAFYATYKRPDRTADIIAVLIGGFEMILGYFIAEYILYGAAAYVELFYNLFQVLIGMGLSIMVLYYIERLV